MPHFFIKEENRENNLIKIDDSETFSHLVKVRRVKIGEDILFFDKERTEYFCKVTEISKKELRAEIINSYKSERELKHDISVAKCVLKADADFSAIQKATELGVKRIIPVISDNCAVNPKIIYAKSDKFQKIADESVKQCERIDFPVVETPVKIDEVIKRKDFDLIIIFSEKEKYLTIKKFFFQNPYKGQSILIITGPEGGFSEREFKLFEDYKIPQLTLGKLIMRADTALTAAVYGVIQEISDD